MFIRQNLVYGKLDAELGAVATTISSSALAGLVVVAAPDRVRVVLDPQGQFGVPELVDVTAHTVDATSATVVRAVEDSGRLPARVHPVGTRWAVVDTVESLPVAAIDSGVVAGGARIAVAPPEWVGGEIGSISITSQALVDDPNPNPGPGEPTGDEVPGDGGTQVGPAAWAEGNKSSAVGMGAWAGGHWSSAIGVDASAEGNLSSAVGVGAWAGGHWSSAVGVNASAEGYQSSAVGVAASAEGYQSSAVGVGALATGDRSLAVGVVAKAEHDDSVALGAQTRTTAVDQVHIGDRHLMSDAGRAVVSEDVFSVVKLSKAAYDNLPTPRDPTVLYIVD